jgi:ribose transport system ATP-binding protein
LEASTVTATGNKARHSGPLLAISNLSKSFGGVKAVNGATFSIGYGEVHGLLGHNGSGKSTLIKVLAGFHAPDEGSSVRLRGEEIAFPMAAGSARKLGISFVHQHLGLIPSLTVLENLLLGNLSTQSNWSINWKSEREQALALFKRYHIDLDPDSVVSDITPVERALLAIVRAFRELQNSESGLLILDEPTPFLPRVDVQRLFGLVRKAVADGTSVIFVSHDIDEVQEITDKATVLRDGKVVDTFHTAATDKDAIVQMIVGHKMVLDKPVRERGHYETFCAVKNLSGAIVKDISFELGKGEILGLTGLIGSGYDEIPSLLYGANRAQAGHIDVDGKALSLSTLEPAVALENGFVLIPADRLEKAVIGTLSLAENMSMPIYKKVTHSWLISNEKLHANTAQLLDAYDVRPRKPDMMIGSLSGGNQQKAVMAKWLQLGPKLILLDEPTQGVDVGAREQLFKHLRNAASAGASILVASSDFEQLEMLCDRVLVFGKGRITSTLVGHQISKNKIAEECFGADHQVGEFA